MSTFTVLFKKELQKTVTSSACKILLIVLLTATAAGSAAFSIILYNHRPLLTGPGRAYIELFAGLILYFLPMFELLLFVWALSSIPAAGEKEGGIIDSLLAAAVDPKTLWTSKTLSVFVPGAVTALVSTIVIAAVVNLAVVIPAGGAFLFPPAAAVTGLGVNLVLMLSLLGITVYLVLSGNPDTSIMPSFMLGFGLMAGVPLGMVLEAFDILSWRFTLWSGIGTAGFLVITLLLARKLSAEKILLSSR